MPTIVAHGAASSAKRDERRRGRGLDGRREQPEVDEHHADHADDHGGAGPGEPDDDRLQVEPGAVERLRDEPDAAEHAERQQQHGVPERRVVGDADREGRRRVGERGGDGGADGGGHHEPDEDAQRADPGQAALRVPLGGDVAGPVTEDRAHEQRARDPDRRRHQEPRGPEVPQQRLAAFVAPADGARERDEHEDRQQAADDADDRRGAHQPAEPPDGDRHRDGRDQRVGHALGALRCRGARTACPRPPHPRIHWSTRSTPPRTGR